MANLLPISGYLLISNISHLVFCIFAVLYMRHVLDSQNDSHQKYLCKHLMLVVLFFLIADMLTYVFDTQRFFGARFANEVFMFASILLTPYIGALLNNFYDVIFHIDENKSYRRTLYMLPTIGAFLLLFANLFTDIIFVIDENNIYHRGYLYILSFLMQYIPFAVVMIRAMFHKFKTKTLRYIKLRSSIIYIGMLALIFGLLQALAGARVALHCFGITAGIFILFLRFQDDQITNDSLTGLNNRYALDSYITEKMRAYADGSKGQRYLYLITMDINDFKRINDIHGHSEGDRALRTVSDILKKIGGKYKSDLFISRFGGDEFLAVYEASSEKMVKTLCEDIKSTIKTETDHLKYRLTLSAGYAAYTGKEMSMSMLYELSDSAMYKDKHEAKSALKLE